MGSFYQNGLVANLHDFSYGVKGLNNYERLENDLKIFSKKNPMELILPSLYSELEGKALPKIINEIKATKAPIIKISPWAKLIIPIIP